MPASQKLKEFKNNFSNVQFHSILGNKIPKMLQKILISYRNCNCLKSRFLTETKQKYYYKYFMSQCNKFSEIFNITYKKHIQQY